jgi:tetratricopeptide (TPR) repeat protein
MAFDPAARLGFFPMRLLLSLLLLAPAPFAEEEPSGEEGEIAPSEHPGSDSPEAVRAQKYQGPRRRAQAFLIPMDEKARASTARVAQAIEDVLSRTPMYEVVDLGRILSVESTSEQASRADEGRKLVSEANLAALSKGWREAAGIYEKALQALERGLPAVEPPEYADALLRLGAAQWMSGEEKTAKSTLRAAARLDPQRKLDVQRIEPGMAPLLQAARAEAESAQHGALDVDSRPPGARVTVDGEVKGNSPIHAEVPSGKHLLRIERAGFHPHAELVEIPPRKTAQRSVSLQITPAAASLNQAIAGAAAEAGRGYVGKSVGALAEKFSLERVLIGSVRSQEEKVAVLLALVDPRRRKVVASQRLLLLADGTDTDQIETDAQNATRSLVQQDSSPAEEGPAARAEKPALANKEPHALAEPAPATEPKEPAAKKKKKGLQGKTGTEAWPED